MMNGPCFPPRTRWTPGTFSSKIRTVCRWWWSGRSWRLALGCVRCVQNKFWVPSPVPVMFDVDAHHNYHGRPSSVEHGHTVWAHLLSYIVVGVVQEIHTSQYPDVVVRDRKPSIAVLRIRSGLSPLRRRGAHTLLENRRII